MSREPLVVTVAGEYGSTTHYRVGAAGRDGQAVTVRVGRHGVFCCLTCLKTDCRHADAAEEYAKESATTTMNAA